MMNTKTIMTLSAVILGASGVILTFIPDTLLNYFTISPNEAALFLMQILGALYLAFGMLNWLAKASLIGGIYNRPIAVANLTHFLVAGLALLKGLISNPDMSYIIWVVGIIYILFSFFFGILLFRHPVAKNN